MTDEPLFKTTHDALRFAFGYMERQSPKTPLMSMVGSGRYREEDSPPRSDSISNGNRLIGLDAAAQAGMILAEVCRLPDDQHNVIVARYYRTTHECKCCGSEVPREEWSAAIDALSHCVELEGVHRKVRNEMVKKAVCGGKLDIDRLCKEHSLARRTLYAQLASIKTKFRKLERTALINLDNIFFHDKMLVA